MSVCVCVCVCAEALLVSIKIIIIFIRILYAIGLMSREFANDSGDRGSIRGRVIPKIQKIVLDPIYPSPPIGPDMTQGQFLSGV